MTKAHRYITEKDLTRTVREMALALGWLYSHDWTRIHSPEGLPDLILARPPRLIFAELKGPRGKVTPKQRMWLDTLKACPGVEVYLWQPEDLDWIEEVLR